MAKKAAFSENDAVDRLFAVIYLAVGYGFIQVMMFSYGKGSLAVYTIFYAVAVLLYLHLKKMRPPAESWFWLAVMLALGIPLEFWTVMEGVQVLALIAVAAYWTLCASGRLLGDRKTSQWVFFDVWNALAAVPFKNFTCLVRTLFAKREKQARDDGAEQAKDNEAEQAKAGGAAQARADEAVQAVDDSAGQARRGSWLGSVLLGILIAVPLLAVVLPLLSGADAGFSRIVGHLVEMIENLGQYLARHFLTILIKIIFSIPVSFYLFGLVFGGIHGRNTDTVRVDALLNTGKSVRKLPDVATCTALAILCAVYVLFIGLQGSYLFSAFAGTLPGDFTYAEYARSGFFELCRIGAWNLIFLGLAGLFSRTPVRKHKGLRILTILLSVLTLLLLATAVSKLAMYISVYGLTVKRVVPMVFMLWLALVFVAVIVRQHKNFVLIRFCVMAGAVLFCLLCVFPVERWTELYNTWARARGLIL